MLNSNKILVVFVLSLLIAVNAFAQSTILSDLIDETISNNPRLKAAYSNWQAAKEKIRVVKGLPDPVVRYTYFDENVETRVGPQERKYGVSQKIPFPGKLGLKAKAQSKQAKVFGQKYEFLKRELIKELKYVFYDIFWVDKAIDITEEEKTILESLERVAQRKYESNKAPQQDVIKAQVELTKLIDRLYFLRQNRKSLMSKMNSILGRNTESSIKKIVKVDSVELTLSLEELKNISNENNQMLLAADLKIRKAEHEKALAKMAYLPDFTFGFDRVEVGGGSTTHPEDGKDAIMGTIALTVPLWFDRINAQIREKKELLSAAKSNREDTQNNLKYEVEDSYYKIISYRDIISLYRTALLPQVQQSYEAAKISYETGKVDFLNWLDAERLLLDTRLAYYKVIVDHHKVIAYLEKVIGKDL